MIEYNQRARVQLGFEKMPDYRKLSVLIKDITSVLSSSSRS